MTQRRTREQQVESLYRLGHFGVIPMCRADFIRHLGEAEDRGAGDFKVDNERLREALRRIADEVPAPAKADAVGIACQRIAQEALAGKVRASRTHSERLRAMARYGWRVLATDGGLRWAVFRLDGSVAGRGSNAESAIDAAIGQERKNDGTE